MFFLSLLLLLTNSQDVGSSFNHGVDGLDSKWPLIIAHRGSSGILPEHTTAAYKRGIQDGAHMIECDVVLSRDLVPVCNHDVFLDNTTNVADLPQFADRKKTYTVQDHTYEGWFALDFNLTELQMLRRRQAVESRDQSHNNKYSMVTLEDFIDLAENADHVVGIYPELKYPVFHNTLLSQRGVSQRFEDVFLEVLVRRGYTKATQPCFLQCFEESSLLYLRNRTALSLVMLIENDVSQDKLREWGKIFYGVGCWKEQIIRIWTQNNGYKNYISERTDFVKQAHEVGLKVHVYTFRNDDQYLAWDYGQDPSLEYDDYLDQGVDGYFTDFPATLVRKLGCSTTSVAHRTGPITTNLVVIILLQVSKFLSYSFM